MMLLFITSPWRLSVINTVAESNLLSTALQGDTRRGHRCWGKAMFWARGWQGAEFRQVLRGPAPRRRWPRVQHPLPLTEPRRRSHKMAPPYRRRTTPPRPALANSRESTANARAPPCPAPTSILARSPRAAHKAVAEGRAPRGGCGPAPRRCSGPAPGAARFRRRG